jgi:hypothetical protein
MASIFSFSTRDLFNALINGDRGYQAPYPQEKASLSVEADAMLENKGPRVLAYEPAASIGIAVVPQAHDFVHAFSMSRMLPAFSFESTSGGWVALSYAFDPPPDIPEIILPQPQWQTSVGDVYLTGLTTAPTPLGALFTLANAPEPGIGYPALIGNGDNVVTNGAL